MRFFDVCLKDALMRLKSLRFVYSHSALFISFIFDLNGENLAQVVRDLNETMQKERWTKWDSNGARWPKNCVWPKPALAYFVGPSLPTKKRFHNDVFSPDLDLSMKTSEKYYLTVKTAASEKARNDVTVTIDADTFYGFRHGLGPML